MTMSAHPALVLNADFRPMSYFPLSLLCWEDAVQAVFSERVSVVAEYDTWVHSPSTKTAAVRGSAAQVSAFGAARCLHAVQRVPARPLHLPVLQRCVRIFSADLRTRDPTVTRRSDDLVEHRLSLRALQPGQGQLDTDEATSSTTRADNVRAAGRKAQVPAQPSA